MRTAHPMGGALLAASAGVLLVLGGCAADADDQADEIILATTTSTQDSGLLDDLLPDFEEEAGCTVKTVAVGSGQAMTMGERDDADVLLVHSPDAEEEFMAAGHGVSRDPVMHNDFVLVGPSSDPAGVADAENASEALERIADADHPFASRADDSGTNAKELSLWEEAGISPSGDWYVETGQGMGETLTIADQKSAYALTDRGTYLATNALESTISYEGSRDLRNDYHVIVVDRDEPPVDCAESIAEWLQEPEVQARIGGFGVNEYGEPLFFPDVHPES